MRIKLVMTTLPVLASKYAKLIAEIEKYSVSLDSLGYSIDSEKKLRRYGTLIEDPMELLEYQQLIANIGLAMIIASKIANGDYQGEE